MVLPFYGLLVNLAIISTLLINILYPFTDKNIITLKPSGNSLMTEIIQKAIDDCESRGGGVVRFAKEEHYSGTILLKSNVRLHLHKQQ